MIQAYMQLVRDCDVARKHLKHDTYYMADKIEL